jgi:SulP family sulfate permease
VSAKAATHAGSKPVADLYGWGSDLVSGAVVSLVSLAYSLSFAYLIFAGPLAGNLQFGIASALLSAGICTIVVALGSTFGRAIGGPDSAPMAIMSGLAATVAAHVALNGGGDEARLMTVLAALATAALATGAFLVFLGSLRLETVLRYIPYPVIAGFIAAVGLQLAAGGAHVLTDVPISLRFFGELLKQDTLAHLAAGLAFAATVAAARYASNSPLAVPLALIGGTAVCYVMLAALGFDIDMARASHWLLSPPLNGDGFTFVWSQPGAIDWSAIAAGSGEIAAGAAIVAINVLLNTTGLELWSRSGLDLNRELVVNGVANLASGALGGMPGNISLNRTILNTRSGATGPRAAALSGAILIALSAIGPGIVGVVPAPVLGGLLIYLGLGVLWDTFARARHTLGPADYAFLAMLVIVIIWLGYFIGVALGVIASCVLFVVRYSRVETVRHDLTRENFASTLDRPREDAELLRRSGRDIHILWLRGFLFFGTANRLYAALVERMTHDGKGFRHLVLDFGRVSGIDSSSVFSFVKLAHLARDRKVSIAFCGLSRGSIAAFRGEGLLHSGDRYVRAFPTLDQGLEWCEDNLLHAGGRNGHESEKAVSAWLAEELGSPERAARLESAINIVSLEKDAVLFREGDAADALYFIAAGRLSVEAATPDGGTLRLRAMSRHTVLGEMGLYRSLRRTATVLALEDSRVLRLSRDAFATLRSTDPDLGDAIHQMVVRTLADRLAFANTTVIALQ